MGTDFFSKKMRADSFRSRNLGGEGKYFYFDQISLLGNMSGRISVNFALSLYRTNQFRFGTKPEKIVNFLLDDN